MDWGSILAETVNKFFGVQAAYFALAAMRLNVHFGYTGLLNFGHAGFMAIGAYGLAISLQNGVPLLLAVLFAAAWLFYRRLRLAIAVLLPAVTAIAWTGGAVAWLGHRLDPIASLLDPVLLTIGVAASVHFVEAFRRARGNGHAPGNASIRARLSLRKPAFWATTTTMLGLWSLTINDTPAVVDFGLRAAMGVALTHLFTFSLLPS